MNFKKSIFILMLFLVAQLTRAQQTDIVNFYVSPKGNDTNTGSVERPFATLSRARDMVRQMKQSNSFVKDFHIILRGGTYTLDSALVFIPDDSAPTSGKICYEAYPGEVPVISAGIQITGWKEENGMWVANVPKAGWNFEQLFVNGKRAVRARTPDTGYSYVDMAGTFRNGEDISRKSFYVLNNSDAEGLEDIKSEDLNNVVVTLLYDNWLSGRYRLKENIPQEKLLILTGNTARGFSENSAIKRGVRYYIEGFRKALNARGEWFLDRSSGKVYYIPLRGEKPANAEAYASNADRFMVFKGEPVNGRYITGIDFKNLVFRYAATNTPPAGNIMTQSASGIPANILLDGVNSVNFEGCEISHIGGYAIQYRDGCTDSKVQKCLIYDLGGGGIYLSDGKYNGRLPQEAMRTSHIIIDNNIIYSGGRVWRDASAVLSTQCSDITITHNEIADFYYIAVSVGWTWNYDAPSLAQRNKTEYNHIHHIGQRVLSDHGGIYTLGEASGSVIVGNKIHDISAYCYGGWGIYNDQASNGIIIENNLVYNAEGAGYFMNWAKNDTVRNNIFALNKYGAIDFWGGGHPASFNFTNNIVYSTNGIITARLTGNDLKKPELTFEKNLYWSTTGKFDFIGMTMKEWQALGKDHGSIIADPQFVDPEKHNFTLKSGSPYSEIGFKPFDISKAGVYGDARWIAKAAVTPTPDSEPEKTKQALTPIQLDLDFESIPVGEIPYSFSARSVKKGDEILVGVTGEQAKSGKHSFKLAKDDDIQTSRMPQITLYPCHFGGLTTLSFDFKLQGTPGLNVFLQDRSMQAIITGPAILFENDSLFAGNKKIAAVEKDQWVHMELKVKTGKDADGKFAVTVTLPGGRVIDNQLTYSSDWNYLDYLAFSLSKNKAQVVYLDNLKLTHTK